MTRASALLLALLLWAALPPGASGQEEGLSFVAGLAYEPGGPGASLVTAMRQAGLGDDEPGSCIGTCAEPRPTDYAEGLGIAASLGFRHGFRDRPLAFEALVSNGARGHTRGFDDAGSRDVVVQYSTFLLATTVELRHRALAIHAGPVVGNTQWTVVERSVESAAAGTFSLGATAAVSAGVAFDGTLVSLRAGFRAFPTRDREHELGLPFDVGYRSFYVGVTVTESME